MGLLQNIYIIKCVSFTIYSHDESYRTINWWTHAGASYVMCIGWNTRMKVCWVVVDKKRSFINYAHTSFSYVVYCKEAVKTSNELGQCLCHRGIYIFDSFFIYLSTFLGHLFVQISMIICICFLNRLLICTFYYLFFVLILMWLLKKLHILIINVLIVLRQCMTSRYLNSIQF